jgi:AraC-like DNA-binding protein
MSSSQLTIPFPCTSLTGGKRQYSRHALQCADALKELLLADKAHHIPIKKLARKVGLNTHTLNDAFRYAYRKSIFVYGQHIRLEQGKTLLLQTNLTIQDIAEKCGYPEQSNFSAAFKKKYGISPGRWRKDLRVES